MTKIKPFRAIVYNQENTKDLSRVVCPPYDIISPQGQEHYHDLSPHNLIHILLGKDISGADKYRRAGSYFKEWLKSRVLIRDGTAAIYFYSQQYHLKGEKRTRLGFISLLHLDDKNSSVFRHENTRLEPKEDRLRLLKQVKANLSPIFAIFLDNKRIIQRIYRQQALNSLPFLEVVDEDKISHKLWRLDKPDILGMIEKAMSVENIFIADGHHRYEVACAYRDQMKQKLGDAFTGEEDFNYILTYFTNTDSRGLSILPVHRLLKLDFAIDVKDFLTSLRIYFDVEEVKDRIRFFFLMEKGGRTEHLLGMYRDKRYWLLRLKNIRILDKLMSDKPKAYRSLDVSILNTIILEMILGIDLENKDNLKFSPDANAFISEADDNPLYLAFFLNPVQIQQIIQVALGGQKMPPKSTYFYPKVLSGLVINKFEDS